MLLWLASEVTAILLCTTFKSALHLVSLFFTFMLCSILHLLFLCVVASKLSLTINSYGLDEGNVMYLIKKGVSVLKDK